MPPFAPAAHAAAASLTGGEPPSPSRGSPEHLRLDAARRAARTPEGRLALVLHLDRLAPPAPQPHHRRIARALLLEAAQRHDGQLFPLRNGDLVLLCRRTLPPLTPGADDPAALPATLARLFGADTPDPAAVVSLWPLGEQADELLGYAVDRLSATAAPFAREAPPFEPIPTRAPGSSLPSEGTLPPQGTLPPPPEALTHLPDLSGLIQRRTAAQIAGASAARARRLRPIFREIAFSLAALEARFASSADPADPSLLRHFARRLDGEMLAMMEAALPGHGPLGMAGCPPSLALHLNLGLETILGQRFEHFAFLCRTIAVPLGIEVPLVEAVAEPGAFARARAFLERSGFRTILGGISYHALLFARPQALGADLLKLEWSARLPGLPAPERQALAAAIAAVGPDRLVLTRADTEAALLWGLGQGIRRFLGRYVESMLGAGRILACPSADVCTLSQCTERAAAATAPGRRFCRNLALLDAGAPEPASP